MKSVLITLLVMFIGASAANAQISFSFTAPEAARVSILKACEALRIESRLLPVNFDKHICAKEMFRRQVLDFRVSHARTAAQVTVNGAGQVEARASNQEFPKSDVFVTTFCGDGIPQLEFGEECDDGNGDDGDGCDSNCTDE